MKHTAGFFAFLAALFHEVGATPLLPRYGDYLVHEKREFFRDAQTLRRLDGDVIVPLRIGLSQQNLDTLEAHLMAVSDPESTMYGQHWSPARVLEVFSPSQESHDAVRAWLLDAGFDANRLSVSHNNAWIEIQGATVSETEALLNTEYHVFEHDGEEHVACHEYSVPAGVAPHIDLITPTVQANTKLVKPVTSRQPPTSLRRRDIAPEQLQDIVTRASVATNGSLAGCDTAVVPSCLQTLYNMTYTPKATDRNTFGIVTYFPDTYLQSDLDTFFRNFSPSLVGVVPKLVSINGGTIDVDPTSDVGEDGWILEYAMTLTNPQPVQFLKVGNPQISPSLSFNEWLDAVDGSYCTSEGGDDFTFDPQLPNPLPGGFQDHSCGTVKPPNVVSNSQGFEELRLSQFYRQRQCNEFGKLGLMGVTVLYSAGNTGTSGTQSGYCLDDNGSMNLNGTHFNPNWPASCPWITAVGGTQVKPNASATDAFPEEVWNQEIIPGFFESGGGGFSNHFTRPSYQDNAVANYMKFLSKTSPGTLKHFNINGRAYPDLSANANMFLDISNGSVSIDSGTSGATPTVASIITLVNDARISAGKKPVVQGDRGGGFNATKGWDPASGVGTPNLGKLIERWLALP
ncbi:Tripeptidyl-peptidase sed1 [Psilocybe cubensis]|uniref:Tripeptidyl-peptidase sed1 n=1 Tax=Psilocybe cubensis TaxID=181762 RepID=A0ACB8GRR1_PSICU|nr:Tripeptidyl-peptidase sed1 [Psilocybe cubensis]KAH9478356.1 Tripeptidyl-peptidase sed1 [Psilocybe cubensis]